MANLMIFGAKITTSGGKPSKVTAGKKTEPSGKVTLHVPAQVGTFTEAIDVCDGYKQPIKLTHAVQEGSGTLGNTAYVSGPDAAGIIRQMIATAV